MKATRPKNSMGDAHKISYPKEDSYSRACRLSDQTAAVLLLSMTLLVSCTTAVAPAPTATPEPKRALVGTWTATVTKEDILRVVPDFRENYLCENAGTFNWTFNPDGTFMVDQTALPGCATPANAQIEDTWSADGNLVTFGKGTPEQEVYEWAVEGDLLRFKRVSGECAPCLAVNTANPWKRVDTSTTP